MRSVPGFGVIEGWEKLPAEGADTFPKVARR